MGKEKGETSSLLTLYFPACSRLQTSDCAVALQRNWTLNTRFCMCWLNMYKGFCKFRWISFYCNYQLSKTRQNFGDHVFNVQIVLMSGVTGSVSSGNLSAFDLMSSKACKIVGNDIVTIGNEENCLWRLHNFKPKTLSPKLYYALLNW